MSKPNWVTLPFGGRCVEDVIPCDKPNRIFKQSPMPFGGGAVEDRLRQTITPHTPMKVTNAFRQEVC